MITMSELNALDSVLGMMNSLEESKNILEENEPETMDILKYITIPILSLLVALLLVIGGYKIRKNILFKKRKVVEKSSENEKCMYMNY